MEINKVYLSGKVFRDPEIKTVGQGMALCQLTITVPRKIKDKHELMFVDLVCFGDVARKVVEGPKKGDPVLVEGKVAIDKYNDAQGQSRTKFKVIADNVEFLQVRKPEVIKDRESIFKQTEHIYPNQMSNDEDVPF